MKGLCPCQSQKSFEDCCGPLLSGEVDAATPEELMRSRYTAFAVRNIDYISETTDPQTRVHFDVVANRKWAEECKFTGLEILKAQEEGNKGLVEFKAKFIDAEKQPQIHHEISKFRKQAGIWYFRDGKVIPAN